MLINVNKSEDKYVIFLDIFAAEFMRGKETTLFFGADHKTYIY